MLRKRQNISALHPRREIHRSIAVTPLETTSPRNLDSTSLLFSVLPCSLQRGTWAPCLLGLCSFLEGICHHSACKAPGTLRFPEAALVSFSTKGDPCSVAPGILG